MTALLPPPVVRLVVCGNADRGDDGVALAAAATLLPSLPATIAPKLEVRRCTELRTEDLIDLPDDMRVLIVDAVLGPPPGDVVRVPLSSLAAHPSFTPRSSHQLPIDLVVGLAGIIRKRPIPGTFVGLAGHRFGFGTPLSRSARAGLPAFRDAIVEELERLVDPAGSASARTAPTAAPSHAMKPRRRRTAAASKTLAAGPGTGA
jgi:hydrogenase maturation protease